MPANPRAANGDDANLLIISVTQLMPQPCAVGEVGRIEAGDVAGERVVLAGPIPDRGSSGPKLSGTMSESLPTKSPDLTVESGQCSIISAL
jgi:hypothetical protein